MNPVSQKIFSPPLHWFSQVISFATTTASDPYYWAYCIKQLFIIVLG